MAIAVTDNGPGIPPDVVDRIFEPFYTTKPEGEGTGLGLAICQGIIKEHGGRMTVDSAPGEGTTLTVELPAAHTQHTGTDPEQVPAGQTPLRVLVVDDEPSILHYMRATLEGWGHRVSVASDGAEAIQVVQHTPFDLILCDLWMPRIGGIEFYQTLYQLDPTQSAKVRFATGDTIRGDTLAFLEDLGLPYLKKPFKIGELRQLLESVGNATGE